MAEEAKEEVQPEKPLKPAKKGKKTLIIIIAAVALVLGAGGFVGYKFLLSGKGDEKGGGNKGHSEKTALIGIDPFVLNLADPGRYLKFTVQFELSDEKQQQLVTEKNSQLRDAIIMLVSSKSSQAVSSAEGKFQLKDEILFRANQIMGAEKSFFKNLYFTEFVMQ